MKVSINLNALRREGEKNAAGRLSHVSAGKRRGEGMHGGRGYQCEHLCCFTTKGQPARESRGGDS